MYTNETRHQACLDLATQYRKGLIDYHDYKTQLARLLLGFLQGGYHEEAQVAHDEAFIMAGGV